MNQCKWCRRILAEVEEIHVVNGELYCSKECAVYSLMEDIMLNVKELAIETYDAEAEIVAAKDIIADEVETLEVK